MKRVFFLLFLAIPFFFGCKKTDNSQPTSYITLKVTPKHHSVLVKSAVVYLKVDATEFPGKTTSVYEMSSPLDGSGVASFPKVLPGNIYLYCEGFDGSVNVIGYMPVVLTNIMLNSEYNVSMAVSE